MFKTFRWRIAKYLVTKAEKEMNKGGVENIYKGLKLFNYSMKVAPASLDEIAKMMEKNKQNKNQN